MDEIDRRLLELLQEDGRITNAELARRVGLSPPSVLQRVRKLEGQKLIDGYYARLNREALGYGLTVMVNVSLSLHQGQPIDEFATVVSGYDEVLECLHVSGDYDFMLKVVAKDMADYEEFVRSRLSLAPGVGRIQSCFVMGHRKSTTRLPLP
ncbi:MAG: Lrp/AsnC family transcriptional regulator [Fimbriimonadaceae bacterium]|nr:Lrp/AsnC family transcriptional regulator [Fimbriimonadaceae bacterium]